MLQSASWQLLTQTTRHVTDAWALRGCYLHFDLCYVVQVSRNSGEVQRNAGQALLRLAAHDT